MWRAPRPIFRGVTRRTVILAVCASLPPAQCCCLALQTTPSRCRSAYSMHVLGQSLHTLAWASLLMQLCNWMASGRCPATSSRNFAVGSNLRYLCQVRWSSTLDFAIFALLHHVVQLCCVLKLTTFQTKDIPRHKGVGSEKAEDVPGRVLGSASSAALPVLLQPRRGTHRHWYCRRSRVTRRRPGELEHEECPSHTVWVAGIAHGITVDPLWCNWQCAAVGPSCQASLGIISVAERLAAVAGVQALFDTQRLELVRRVEIGPSVAAVVWHPKLNQIFIGTGA